MHLPIFLPLHVTRIYEYLLLGPLFEKKQHGIQYFGQRCICLTTSEEQWTNSNIIFTGLVEVLTPEQI